MKEKEIIRLCRELVPEITEAWKYDEPKNFTYDDGRLKVSGSYNRNAMAERIVATFDNENLLYHLKNLNQTIYVPNKKFDEYVKSDDFIVTRTKSLLSKL